MNPANDISRGSAVEDPSATCLDTLSPLLPLNLAVHWSTHPLQSLNRHRRMVACTAARQYLLLRSRVRHGLSQVW